METKEGREIEEGDGDRTANEAAIMPDTLVTAHATCDVNREA